MELLVIGIIGAGNMAGALARGWGDPVLATDNGSGRAATLVAQIGGEVAASNQELIDRADVVLLGFQPHHLDRIAANIDASGKKLISLLGQTALADLNRAFPDASIARVVTNTPVQVRQGFTTIAEGGQEYVSLFERVGGVAVIPESLMNLATATLGVTPAYVAVVAEAMIDAAICAGLPVQLATELTAGTIGGTAALIAHREGDTLSVRREVASPGESTVRGLAALERCGLRNAFAEAANDVMARLGRPYEQVP